MFRFLYNASAQLTLTGQLKTRGELRDGYGTLKPGGSKNAAFRIATNAAYL
jgi:hypothetical protein